MNNQIARGIYLGLDELYDTRLPVLYKAFPEHRKWIDKHVKTGKYHTRIDEHYGPINREMFEKAYKERDADILPLSVITPNVNYIAGLYSEFLQEMVNEPFRQKPVIHLNTYPYNLEKWELDDIGSYFTDLISTTHVIPDVSMFRQNPATFSLEYINDTYSVMFMYDYHLWLEEMSEKFEGGSISAVKLIGPALMRNYRSNDPEVQEFIRTYNLNPMAALQKAVAPLVSLNLQDAEWFSFIGYGKAKNEY